MTKSPVNETLRKISFIVIIVSMAYSLFYFAEQRYLKELSVVSGFLLSVTSFFPVAACFLVVRRYGLKGGLPKVFAFALIGLFMNFLGMATWFILEVPWMSFQYPSVADVFYLLGYPFLMYALSAYLNLFRTPINWSKLSVVLGVAVASTIMSFISLFQPLIASEAAILTKSLYIVYLALDIVLISLSVAGLALFLRSEIEQAWALISLGIILTSVSDVLFSYATLVGVYYSGHLLELPMLGGYLALTLGLLSHIRNL